MVARATCSRLNGGWLSHRNVPEIGEFLSVTRGGGRGAAGRSRSADRILHGRADRALTGPCGDTSKVP
jgi:hypothetical protein